MKILAVEDDPVASVVIEAALKSLNHEVVLASTGSEALELGSKKDISIIVSDWQLPEIDGLELCKYLRERRADYVCFILLTQRAPTDANVERAIAAGVDDFLTKPVKVRELKMRLYCAERTLRLTRELAQLEDMIPMCSYCRKVRDDQDYWDSMEAYLNKRGVGRVSHGVCPECVKKYVLPQYAAMGVAPPKPKVAGDDLEAMR